jgi:hypothetical protein
MRLLRLLSVVRERRLGVPSFHCLADVSLPRRPRRFGDFALLLPITQDRLVAVDAFELDRAKPSVTASRAGLLREEGSPTQPAHKIQGSDQFAVLYGFTRRLPPIKLAQAVR